MSILPIILIEQEVFVKVPSIEYYITKYGRLKNCNSKILRGSVMNNGYLCHMFNKRKTYLKHRLVAKTFIPNPLNLPCVNHKDGNKLNNKVSNLEWCTVVENNKHARDNGFNNFHTALVEGESHGMSKLTESIVKQIRSLYASGHTQKEIAAMFGVQFTTIGYVVNYKTWKHVK